MYFRPIKQLSHIFPKRAMTCNVLHFCHGLQILTTMHAILMNNFSLHKNLLKLTQ